jgi:hypothetical protein
MGEVRRDADGDGGGPEAVRGGGADGAAGPHAGGPRTKPGSNTIDFDSASERAFDRMRKDDEHIAGCMRAKGYVR